MSMHGDFMTAAHSSNDASFSYFNIALLKDMGYWAEVSEEHYDDFAWGSGRGCDFLTGECATLTTFDEFVPSSTPNGLPDYFNHG
jgi:proprotein convertase subtilisin/kexin type 5